MKSLVFLAAVFIITTNTISIKGSEFEDDECSSDPASSSSWAIDNNDTDAYGSFTGSDNEDGFHVGATPTKFGSAAVVSDSPPCAAVSYKILKNRGSIADATIAGLVCMGATHPHTSGIGGGFVAVHYDPKTKKSTVINAREKAAIKATEGMYDNKGEDANKVGGLAVAVPGEIKGYMELYKRFGGKAKWEDLFKPTAEILESGYTVSPHMAQALENPGTKERINAEPNLKSVFVNPRTGNVWQEKDTIKEPVLARTLREIGRKGGEIFYDPKSDMNKAMMKELKGRNAILTENDFASYKVTVTDTLKAKLDSYTMHVPAAPASGALFTFLWRILASFKRSMKPNDKQSIHYFIEALKHTYGRRGNLGDAEADSKNRQAIYNFQKNITESRKYLSDVLSKIDKSKTFANIQHYQDDSYSTEDAGTAHFVIVGHDGDAISVTTTINTYLGSSVRSRETGVIFNDQMADFVIDAKERKANPTNSIKGGKRPSTSASPIILTDSKGQVRLNIGGAGGVRIMSAVSMVMMQHLWFNQNIADAIAARRFHNVMDPTKVMVEFEKVDSSDKKLTNDLKSFGHKVQSWTQRTVVVGIARGDDGHLTAAFDPRKIGSVEGNKD